MSCNFFVIWGNPATWGAEIDQTTFASLKDAEQHVNDQRRGGETRPASIFEFIERLSNNGKHWVKA